MTFSIIRRKTNILTLTNFPSKFYTNQFYTNNINHSKYWFRQNMKLTKPSNLPAKSSEMATVSKGKLGFVSWYLGMVKSRPVFTKSVTSCLVFTAADLTSQTLSLPSDESYDVVRTLRMGGYGMVVLGPLLHCWFNFMSRILPGRDLMATGKKMALGQTVFGPFMTVVFFSTNAALQGENKGEIVTRLKRDLVPTMVNGVMYWPLCDFITFRFVPVHLQPLVSNSFSYLWTVYMTYMAGLDRPSAE